MTLQNVSIVLSPTMQISHRVLNIFFAYSKILFKDTVIKRYHHHYHSIVIATFSAVCQLQIVSSYIVIHMCMVKVWNTDLFTCFPIIY